MDICTRFSGTAEAGIVAGAAAVYEQIETQQREWKAATPAPCPNGCGQCCVFFEPDITEVEALYTAAWLLHNKPEWADALCNGTFTGIRGTDQPGCIFFDPENAYHCTIYDGRMEICRLFGFCGDVGKDGTARWRPCKFLTSEALQSAQPPAEHRTYTAAELLERYGSVPPVMDALSRHLLALCPDSAERRYLVRNALPPAIQRLKMIIRLQALSSENPDDPSNPNGTDNGISA